MSLISDEETVTCTTNSDGTKEWRRYGELHRDDGPAIERADGSREWYQNNRLHRTDGPAVEFADELKEWYQDGEFHRIDGPAVEFPDGTKYWYQNGVVHRTDGPAVEHAYGSKVWYHNGTRLVTLSKDEVRVAETDIPNLLVEAVVSKMNLPDKVAFCNWLVFVVLGYEGAQVVEDGSRKFASALLRYLENLDEYGAMPFDWWYALLRDV